MNCLPIVYQSQKSGDSRRYVARMIAIGFLMAMSTGVQSQEVRYSWFELDYVWQDISKDGSQVVMTSQGPQNVDISTSDGNGVKFKASFGTWNNLFMFVDFNSSDIGVDVLVTNSQGEFADSDEFDYTAIRGGVGAKWSILYSTDLYAAVTYDSTDFDFGSFAGEDFDAGDKDIGATVGIRSMLGDNFEVRGHVRYTGVGDVDLTTGMLDADTLYSLGFSLQLVRGLSLSGDYESGQFSNWTIGFRLDLDED